MSSVTTNQNPTAVGERNSMNELELPDAPTSQSSEAVKAWSQPITIPTFEPLPPDRNPMFLEKRVYQGSSGKIYPLPVYNRIAEKAVPKIWQAFHLENEFVRVMILPAIGGRIHLFRDKTNGYDAIYRQDVIKPALVGLAGPWISDGIEFNWPQHHRPATYMPVDTFLERHADSSVTLWCSDHDPMTRLKGTHGICLHPCRSVLELKARLFNRTPFTQSFLWWANVATEVHEQYQSFFPPDVSHIADHAKRAIGRFPLCVDRYYGVDYGTRAKRGVPASERPAKYLPDPTRASPNDLSWYANIPVPTSYMCTGTKDDFFGGYDHKARSGLVHVASHHVAPGKKQWTWGNHEFGYAWDRLLTEPDKTGAYRPYIELMAGVFTDNQPDFSFLAPGETKSFSQFWYPIREIGPAKAANIDAAMSWNVDGKRARLGIATSRVLMSATCRVRVSGRVVHESKHDLAPDKPIVQSVKVRTGEVEVELLDAAGAVVLKYRPAAAWPEMLPAPATEPPFPNEIQTSDELYITGVHLDQYRHATRMPELYWLEALRRDPLDSRCNTAMGYWHLHRGEFDQAESHFRRAIERQTRRNPNPRNGEALYGLGLTLRYVGRDVEAYDVIYKSAWNHDQQAAAYLALAEIDCTRDDYASAIGHVRQSLRVNGENLCARDLHAHLLRKSGHNDASRALLVETLTLDPLDWTARWLLARDLRSDGPTQLDVAIDLSRWGDFAGALKLLSDDAAGHASLPMRSYYISSLQRRLGLLASERETRHLAARESSDFLFPSRLEDLLVLNEAIVARPSDARAHFAMGNFLYDRKRHRQAIKHWESSAKIDPMFATVHRNLGIGYFNVFASPKKALRAYSKAVAVDPKDARLCFERDQLLKRLGTAPTKRLAILQKRRTLVEERDDLSVEYSALLNQVGRHQEALALLLARHFQPWEGGEGQALGQYVTALLGLGRAALARGDADAARDHFLAALKPPVSIGETRHLLANMSHVHYWLGVAFAAAGESSKSIQHHRLAAEFVGDFQGMSVRTFSEMTYYSALSQREIGKASRASQLLQALLRYAKEIEHTKAEIDYFATSLPTMLLFEDDLQLRLTLNSKLMQAQAYLGLGRHVDGLKRLKEVLKLDPTNAVAMELQEATRVAGNRTSSVNGSGSACRSNSRRTAR